MTSPDSTEATTAKLKLHPESFGIAAICGTIRGGAIGVLCGGFVFYLLAPLQSHTWPGEIDTTLTYGPPFGAAAGGVLGAGYSAAAKLNDRGLRQLLRFLAGLLAPLGGAVFAIATGDAISGRIPSPLSIGSELLEGHPALGLREFTVLTLGVALGMVGAGLIRESRNGPRRVAELGVAAFIAGGFGFFTHGGLALLVSGGVWLLVLCSLPITNWLTRRLQDRIAGPSDAS